MGDDKMYTLKRKIYDDLLDWKKRSGGVTALMIDGARRVGKSFLCEQFAKNEYKSHIIIDFGNAPKDILDLFDNDSYNLDLFFAKLSAFYSKTLHKRNSVIVFDEVQQFPRARQLIKYLVADGRYDFIETGSLIRLKKNVQDIIIPSEEEHIEMFPLDFEEFLWALGDEVTAPLIRQCFEMKTPLGQALHRKIMNDFRQYILVGGMPQAVLEYVKTKDFINEGMIMENIAAQMLRRNGHKLYFYSRNDKVCRDNHMEIDFLITEKKKIAPIEVKSGSYKSHVSLDKFKKKFSPKLSNSYILYAKDVMIKDDIIHLPVYMAMFL
jgi:predicted AAA+ superfamily ATPase